MKVSEIASSQKSVHIWFTCENDIHIWFKKLMLDYVMRYWISNQFWDMLFLDVYDSFDNSFKDC
jgi:hypothetical protein